VNGDDTMEKKYYIAYGSNTLEEQMKRRCPDSAVVGTAVLAGFELEFRGAATVVPEQGSRTNVINLKQLLNGKENV